MPISPLHSLDPIGKTTVENQELDLQYGRVLGETLACLDYLSRCYPFPTSCGEAMAEVKAAVLKELAK